MIHQRLFTGDIPLLEVSGMIVSLIEANELTDYIVRRWAYHNGTTRRIIIGV
jgi:hypothetical protein